MTDKEKKKFKDSLYLKGLTSFDYAKLNATEKYIYNGVKSAAERNRIGGKFISKKVETKVKKIFDAGGKLSAREIFAKNQKLIEKTLNEKVTYSYNDKTIFKALETYDYIYIDDRIVSKEKAAEFFVKYHQVLKSKHKNLHYIIYNCFVNMIEKRLYIYIKNKRELNDK